MRRTQVRIAFARPVRMLAGESQRAMSTIELFEFLSYAVTVVGLPFAIIRLVRQPSFLIQFLILKLTAVRL
jgi:hypothetical protein